MTDNMDRYLDGFELHYRSLRSGWSLNGEIEKKKKKERKESSWEIWWKHDMGGEIIHRANGEMRDTLHNSHTASWTTHTASSMDFGECWVARQVINTKDLGLRQKLSQGILAQQEPIQIIEDRRIFNKLQTIELKWWPL